jgi:hypothetical protein
MRLHLACVRRFSQCCNKALRCAIAARQSSKRSLKDLLLQRQRAKKNAPAGAFFIAAGLRPISDR